MYITKHSTLQSLLTEYELNMIYGTHIQGVLAVVTPSPYLKYFPATLPSLLPRAFGSAIICTAGSTVNIYIFSFKEESILFNLLLNFNLYTALK